MELADINTSDDIFFKEVGGKVRSARGGHFVVLYNGLIDYGGRLDFNWSIS